MSIETRATVKALLDLYIKANGNKEITGPQLNEVITDAIDSAFFQLNELRTALSTSYDRGSDSDWNLPLPTEVKEAADQLAQRMRSFETNNFSPNVAYVLSAADGGDDATAELGNPAKPFSTFQKAFLDAPASNFIIQSLGGTFTETFTIVSPNSKSNFILRLDGTIINGDVKLRGCTDGVIYLGGGTINGELDVAQNNSQNISVFDGTINGLLGIGENCNLSFCRIVNSAYALIVDVADLNQRPFISNCYIESTNGIAYNGVANFNTCFIKGNNTAFQPSSNINPTKINKFTNCTLISNGTTLFGPGQVLNGIFKKCHIESTNNYAMQIGSSSSEYLFFEECDIIGANDVVYISSSLVRTSTTRTTFKRCSFYTRDVVNKNIFVEQGYPGADLGKFQLIGTTLYNKAFTTSNVARFEVLGDQITTDAQIPPL